MTCENCRFWQSSKSSRRGDCRRYAPRPGTQVGTQGPARWPRTNHDDWCGEFERKPETADE